MEENKKTVKIKKKPLIIVITLVAILIVLVILLFANRNTLKGRWTTDNVTVYEFKSGNTGSLILPLGEYKFTYKTNKNKLYIDFENEKSEDSEYEYHFDHGKLILKGTNGTFTFEKQKAK